MGKFMELFKSVRNNDISAINKSIENVGRRHHAVYMSDMMFTDDMDINYRLLLEVQNTVDSFYKAVSDNYFMKKDAQDLLGNHCKNRIIPGQDFTFLTNEQLSGIIYQQAMKYYFKINVKNESDFSSYYDEAIQYRITSNLLQSDIERILTKMYEDIEIIVEDTKNIEFLMRNYKKVSKHNNLYQCISEQLAESIENVIIRDDKFDKDYFITVRRISFVLHQNF